MADTVILAEQTISGFITEDEVAVETTIPLVVGETYSIEWDGTVYECVGQDLSAVGEDGVVAIGNLTGAGNGLVGNNEPFSIGYVPASLTGSVDILSLVCCAGDCESDTHTVAIYQVIEDEEPETPEEPEGIVLKDRNGKDVAYYGIETVTFDTTTEGKQQVYTKGVAVEGLEIVPDFSKGDMAVVAPKNTLVKSANIRKPADLKPENVREGVKLAGVTGTLPKFDILENLPIALDFSVGDQHVVAPEGTAVKSAVIQKPADLKPEYIAEGIDIAGVIGTHKGGNAEGDTVNFYDYDGSLVASYTVDEANALTALPEPPAHEGLTFQEWNYTLEEVRTTTHMLDVGANYITTDGKTRFYFNVDSSITFKFNYTQTVSGGAVIDWGDGSTNTLTGTSVEHTYEPGTYCAILTVTNGNKVSLGGSSSSAAIFYKTNILTEAKIGENVALNSYAFYNQGSLLSISIPTTLVWTTYAFALSGKLRCVVVPRGVTTAPSFLVRGCSALKVLSLPLSITTISGEFYGLLCVDRVVIPDKVTSITSNLFSTCYTLKKVHFPDKIQDTYNISSWFYYCYGIESVKLPAGIRTLSNNTFNYCVRLREVVIPDGVTSIDQAFTYCYSLEKIVFPKTITTVMTDFLGYSSFAKIYVPDDMLDTYKNMTNLSKYAHRIFPISEMPQDE